MKQESKEETRYDIHVCFRDGRVLYMSDDLDSIVECLKKWDELIDYCTLRHL